MKTANSADHWFHRIIQLGDQYTPLPGTKHGPKPHAFSHRFARAGEAALGFFQHPAQAPDIPGISTRAAISQYTASLQAQSKAPDIPLLSLRASMEDLLVSFNAQAQAPDDPSYVQNPQCAPRDWLSSSPPFSQVLSRLPIRLATEPCQVPFDFPPSSAHQIPVRTQTTGPQAYSRKEFS